MNNIFLELDKEHNYLTGFVSDTIKTAVHYELVDYINFHLRDAIDDLLWGFPDLGIIKASKYDRD